MRGAPQDGADGLAGPRPKQTKTQEGRNRKTNFAIQHRALAQLPNLLTAARQSILKLRLKNTPEVTS